MSATINNVRRETMTLTRALAEVKRLGERINKATNEAKFVGLVKGKQHTPVDRTFVSADQLKARIEGDLQSVRDLMLRRAAIKSAISFANSNTSVKVGDSFMTISEAVEKKNSVSYERNLLSKFKAQLQSAATALEQAERELNASCERQVQNSFAGGQKPGEDAIRAVIQPVIDIHKVSLFDPIGLSNLIEKTERDLDNFLHNVDFALSEVNAKTEIEVKY